MHLQCGAEGFHQTELTSSSLFYLRAHKLYTPTGPFIPGQFVTSNRTLPSWVRYKVSCIAWNSFHFKGFPITFQTTKISFLFWTKRCLFPWGSNSRSGNGVNSSGHCIDISNRRGRLRLPCWCNYYHFFCFFLIDPFKNSTYQNESRESVWKHFVPTLLQCICCYASWVRLPYYILWKLIDSPDGKRFTVGYSKYLVMLWKMLWWWNYNTNRNKM